MYTITIEGEAHTGYEPIKDLHGIECPDEFTEYFGEKYLEEENEQSLIDKGVNNGYAHFEVKDDKLFVVTTYFCDQKLSWEELKILSDYTQGQWSDGIGEGFEQNPVYIGRRKAYISMWDIGQNITITQKSEIITEN